MPAARMIDLPSHQPLSSGSAERSGTVAGAALLTAILALLAIALLGWAYYGTEAGVYPDPTQQWTD